jgi:hypothetical protein
MVREPGGMEARPGHGPPGYPLLGLGSSISKLSLSCLSVHGATGRGNQDGYRWKCFGRKKPQPREALIMFRRHLHKLQPLDKPRSQTHHLQETWRMASFSKATATGSSCLTLPTATPPAPYTCPLLFSSHYPSANLAELGTWSKLLLVL